MTHYEAYFNTQYGGSGRGVHNVFVGSRGQRGHGIGSFLAGLFRRALPFITKGARAIGKEAVRAGINVLDDVSEKNILFKDSLQNRMSESGQSLKRKATSKIIDLMEGSGYKSLTHKRLMQLHRGNRTRKKLTRLKKKKTKRLTQKKRKGISKKKKKKVIKSVRSRKGKKKSRDIFD